MKIIVVRHARTDYNEKHLINSRADGDHLSESGKAQIPTIILSLKKHYFNTIYISPMQRSKETAEPIAEHFGLSVIEDNRLIEVDLGSFIGQPWDSTVADFGKDSSAIVASCEYDFRPYGGESGEDVKQRVQDFVADLKRNPQQQPLIICHGAVMRWFHYLYTNEKIDHIANAEVFAYEV